MGGVDFLGLEEGLDDLVLRRKGNLFLVLKKGVFLHVSGEGSAALFDDSAFRHGCAGRYLKKGESGGIKEAHMAGLMLDDHGMIGGGFIQLGKGGTPAAGNPALVKIAHKDPLARLRVLPADSLLNERNHLFQAVCLCQGNLQKGHGHLEKVAVGIDEGGEEGAALKVDEAGVWGGCLELGEASQGFDFPVFCQQGFWGRSVLQGDDGAVVKNRSSVFGHNNLLFA